MPVLITSPKGKHASTDCTHKEEHCLPLWPTTGTNSILLNFCHLAWLYFLIFVTWRCRSGHLVIDYVVVLSGNIFLILMVAWMLFMIMLTYMRALFITFDG